MRTLNLHGGASKHEGRWRSIATFCHEIQTFRMFLSNVLLDIEPVYIPFSCSLSDNPFELDQFLDTVGVSFCNYRNYITFVMKLLNETPIITMGSRPSEEEQTTMNSCVLGLSLLFLIHWALSHSLLELMLICIYSVFYLFLHHSTVIVNCTVRKSWSIHYSELQV